MTAPVPRVRYRVTGMDCADDAAEIERAARTIGGVDDAKISVATQVLTVVARDEDPRLPAVERAVSALGYQLDRMDARRRAAADSDDDDLPKDLSHITAAYKRALWIVVVLNVGYGLIEMIGGFLADSQALRADALDFLGDGLITFLGLVAIGWSLGWRARSALFQGFFLGALGLSVLATTAYRVFAQQQPEAEMMGVLGAIALVVTVAAAVVLIPHRTGDANARAVWLFSRNDAIGNAAVVVAAGLVAWTGTSWPDLVVAVVIAALFLHSAWAIVRDARSDLREAGACPPHRRSRTAPMLRP